MPRTRLRVLPYGPSNSARDLARALGGMRLRLEGSRFRQNISRDVIINWGRSGAVEGITPTLNSYTAVGNAADKARAFALMFGANVSVPEFTNDDLIARQWLRDGHKVVERHTLRGNSGDGIRIVDSLEDFQPAPLYVKYIPKQQEFRVHVMGSTVIDVQQKRRSRDVDDADVNWQVRNLAGGFIFARENLEVPQQVLDEAVKAVIALELDFGAVDIIFNTNRGVGYVLEVNTACGLQGSTLETYANAFQNVIAGRVPTAWSGTITNPQPRSQRDTVPSEPTPVAPAAVLFAGTDYEGQTVEQLTERLSSILDEAETIDRLLQGA